MSDIGLSETSSVDDFTRFFADGKIAEEWVEFDALEFSPPSSALFYKCPHRK